MLWLADGDSYWPGSLNVWRIDKGHHRLFFSPQVFTVDRCSGFLYLRMWGGKALVGFPDEVQLIWNKPNNNKFAPPPAPPPCPNNLRSAPQINAQAAAAHWGASRRHTESNYQSSSDLHAEKLYGRVKHGGLTNSLLLLTPPPPAVMDRSRSSGPPVWDEPCESCGELLLSAPNHLLRWDGFEVFRS